MGERKFDPNIVYTPPDNLVTGTAALRETGMQHEFAAHLTLQLGSTGNALSFRAGNPPSYDAKRAPKSGLNLSKTANHGFVKSLIPVDPELMRINPDGTVRKHDDKDLAHLAPGAKEPQATTQVRYSLREIVAMTDNKNPDADLNIISFDAATGQMRLRYKPGKGPANFNGGFVINLNDPNQSREQRHFTRPWLQQDPPKMPPSLAGLSPKTYDVMIGKTPLPGEKENTETEFPIQYYSHEPDPHQQQALQTKPLRVFANVENGPPVTGDWDILAMGHPPDLPQGRTVYNTFLGLEQRDNLWTDAKALHGILQKKAQDKLKSGQPLSKYEKYLINYSFKELFPDTPENRFALEHAGAITPFEFLHSRMINLAYSIEGNVIYGEEANRQARINKVENKESKETSELEQLKSADPNIQNLIQHGAENRNPYKPSDLDGKMLHFYRGQIILTKSEDELIDFYLHEEPTKKGHMYLKDNNITVHRGWPMQKWGAVVEKQLELKRQGFPQEIPPATLKSYNDFQALQALSKGNFKSDKKGEQEHIIEVIKSNMENYQSLPATTPPNLIVLAVTRLVKTHPENFAKMMKEIIPEAYKHTAVEAFVRKQIPNLMMDQIPKEYQREASDLANVLIQAQAQSQSAQKGMYAFDDHRVTSKQQLKIRPELIDDTKPPVQRSPRRDPRKR